jgi:hypothetical protein
MLRMDGPDPLTSASRVRAIGTPLLAGLVFAVAVLRYVPFVDDPWDMTFSSTNSACYAGNIVRSFREAGFSALKGKPHLWVEPIRDPPGLLAYTHHPPLSFWLEYASVEVLGWNETAIRVVPILFTAISVTALFLLVARHYGRLFGLGAAALGLTMPMSLLYGWMANYEAGILCMFMLGFLLHDGLRRRPLRSWWPTLVPCFVAPLIDWQGAFLGPGLLLYELLHPRGDRRPWRVLLVVGPVAILSVATVVALDVWWSGGDFELAMKGLLGVASAAATTSWTFLDWIRKQAHYWVELMTWPVSILALLGLLLSGIMARRDAVARLSLAFFAIALLNAALFPARSINHDFWWFTGIPAAACATLVVLKTIAGASRIRTAICLAACLAMSVHAGVDSVGDLESARTNLNLDLARELNTIASRGDLILFSIPMHCIQFYLDAKIYGPVQDPGYLRWLATHRGHPDLTANRLLFVTSSVYQDPPALTAALPEVGRIERLTKEDLRVRMPVWSLFLPDMTIVHVGER